MLIKFFIVTRISQNLKSNQFPKHFFCNNKCFFNFAKGQNHELFISSLVFEFQSKSLINNKIDDTKRNFHTDTCKYPLFGTAIESNDLISILKITKTFVTMAPLKRYLLHAS